ncbi:MAG: hypothetical protein AAI978_00035 [Candidatus Hodgkinia cicadicola]
MAAPKKRVSVSARALKRKRLVWYGLSLTTRMHHVDLSSWTYRGKRLRAVPIGAYF